MTSNIPKVADDFSEFRKDLKEAIAKGADQSLKNVIPKLKANIRSVIQTRAAVGQKGVNLPKELEKIPPARAEVIKMITGEDLRLAKVFQASKDNIVYQKNDASNIFPVVNNHVGISQSINSSTSYEGYINQIMDRFSKGVFVDPKTGKTLILPEEAESKLRDAVKIECSTEHIDHPNSKKAFYRWKTSLNKNARKTPGRKYINARMFQDEVKKLMSEAIDLDQIIDMVMEGELKQVQNTLNKIGPSKFKSMIQNVEDMKAGVDLAPDEQALMNAITLTKNIKVQKKATKYKVQYSVVSSFSEDGEQFGDFLLLVQRELSMVIPDLAEEAYRAIAVAIKEAIEKFTGESI